MFEILLSHLLQGVDVFVLFWGVSFVVLFWFGVCLFCWFFFFLNLPGMYFDFQVTSVCTLNHPFVSFLWGIRDVGVVAQQILPEGADIHILSVVQLLVY